MDKARDNNIRNADGNKRNAKNWYGGVKMFWSKKYCQICGKEADKNIVRFGKSFCSEEHAEQYVEEQKKIENLENQMKESNKQTRIRNRGGCC